jgi:NTP pyrophosphatase (non-canonical NTP hydrolase)
MYPVLGLTNEAGEVAGKVKKIIRDNDGVVLPEHVAEIAAELGDVAWYLAECASALGVTLDEVFRSNLDKLASRAKRGKLKGSGDKR